MHPVLETSDGSHTLRHAVLGVTYHSLHGAITESQHVFLLHGLEYLTEKISSVRILEVGFGTGLNAFLTFLFTREHPALTLTYCAVEKYPISWETAEQLNYAEILAPDLMPVFKSMHQQQRFKTAQFEFEMQPGDILDFSSNEPFELIYFDAFAPGAQPELWTQELFARLYQQLCPGGVLVTYCAQGQFRRNLKSAGFHVTKLPGPPGKREMVRALRPAD